MVSESPDGDLDCRCVRRNLFEQTSFRRVFQEYNWGHVVFEGNSVTDRRAYTVEKRSKHGIYGRREALWRMVGRLD